MISLKPCVFRFSDIEVQEVERRVSRAGKLIALEPKTFQILVYLLHNPGHLVSKDELVRAVWGTTAVTDGSLTRAMTLLRRALDDDPHDPRFIETVATAGYRFICPVEGEEDSSGKSAAGIPDAGTNGAAVELSVINSAALSTQAIVSGTKRRRLWVIIGASALLLAFVGSAVWYLRRPLRPPRVTNYSRLTLDGLRKNVIGTDGNSLFLNVAGPFGAGQIPISGGSIVPFVPDLPSGALVSGEAPGVEAVSPDGSRLLVWGHEYRDERQNELWVVGTLGRPARLLAKALNATWSPDGKQVVYASNHGDLYVMASDGGAPRLLSASSAPGGAFLGTADLTWSPDGTRVRFTRDHTIWEMAEDGTNLHEMMPGWRESRLACCGRWTPDGDFFLFLSGNTLLKGRLFLPGAQIWAIDERQGPLGQRNSKPFPLTSGPTLWGTPIPSRDGRHIFARGVDLRGELVRFDKLSKQFKPYLGGISAEFLSFSHDGKYVAYVSFPEGILWRANRDGTGVTQLTKPPVYPKLPRWSPDDKSIVYFDYSPELRDAIYIISAQGGAPRRLLPDDRQPEADPTWSPDGKRLVFATKGFYSAGPQQEPQVHVLDLETHQTDILPPRVGGAHSPRWSPDGRYIAATDALERDIRIILFDLQTRRWSTIFRGPAAGWHQWSHDGRYIYLMGALLPDEPAKVYRVSVTGGKPEPVADLVDGRWTGWYSFSLGLDPEDNPLLLRDQGTDEIYALTLER
jgi:Tol biopolymer transport system component/DNA-binding winged helix-turn-helix (wHTH) protein